MALVSVEAMQRDARLGIEHVSQWGSDGTAKPVIQVALPASYGKKQKALYPLLIVLDSSGIGNAAIDISRLMSDTQEVTETIVVTVKLGDFSLFPAATLQNNGLQSRDSLPSTLSTELLPWLQQAYRVKTGEFALFAHGEDCALLIDMLFLANNLVDHFILSAPICSPELLSLLRTITKNNAARSSVKTVLCIEPEVSCAEVNNEDDGVDSFCQILQSLLPVRANAQVCRVPDTNRHTIVEAALCLCLRARWATGRKYGAGVDILAKKWVCGLARLLIPLMRRLQPKLHGMENHPTAELVYAEALQRNFEISLSLPSDYHADEGKCYPMLLVLDGNYAFGIVAETARRLAGVGVIDELIVVGLGIPHAEGATAFALRRLVEFSPKTAGYQCDDALGRSLSAIFALYGRDLRNEFGVAADTYKFISEQLLPQLVATLAIDQSDIALMGHSAGATFAGYCIQQPNSPFRRFVCSSPGVAISDSWLMQPKNIRSQKRLWQTDVVLSIGSEEYDNAFNIAAGIPRTAEYAQALAVDTHLNVSRIDVQGETHSSVFFHIVPRVLLQLWAKS